MLSVRPATAGDMAAIQRLLARGRRVYRTGGGEDLPLLVERGCVVIGEEQRQFWGFAALAREPRPDTLPVAAPDRAYLRVLALAHGYAPLAAGVELLNGVMGCLRDHARPTLVIVQGPNADSWLADLLPLAGFGLAEEVHTFRLDLAGATRPTRAQRGGAPAALRLRPFGPADLDPVALLDAQAFDPLWHFSRQDLMELLFSGEMQVATLGEHIIGYSGLATQGKTAHLTRIAVHPDWQGHGVGRTLLVAAIHAARSHGAHTLTLNTQVSNLRSQQLYRALGFLPTGQITPVYTCLVESESLQIADPSP